MADSMDVPERAEKQAPAPAKVRRQGLLQYERDHGPLTEAQKKAAEAMQMELGKVTGGIDLPFKLPF